MTIGLIRNVIMKIINFFIKIIFKDKYGSKVLINGIVYRRGKGTIQAGNNLIINSSKKSNYLGRKDYTTIFIKKGKKLIIGNNVGISNSTIIVNESIIIEDNVMIGNNVCIYDSDFHPLEYNDRLLNKDEKINNKPVYIKEGAFIGAHSIILKGVTVGKHSIIGAGSVVTKSIPDNEVWAGNPARFLRKI